MDSVSDRFATREPGIAQYLVYTKAARLMVLIDEDYRLVYSFNRSPDELRDVIAAYATAQVGVAEYDRAGFIMRKLIRDARYRQQEMDRRTVAGLGRAVVTSSTPTAGVQ